MKSISRRLILRRVLTPPPSAPVIPVAGDSAYVRFKDMPVGTLFYHEGHEDNYRKSNDSWAKREGELGPAALHLMVSPTRLFEIIPE